MQARAAHESSGITKNLMSILLNTTAKNLIKWDVTVQLEFINLSCAALHLYITMQDLLLTRTVSKMILLGTGNPTWGTSDSVLHLQLFLYIQNNMVCPTGTLL